MKTWIHAVLLVVAGSFLAGCEIVVRGGIDDGSGVEIWNASYRTDAKAVVDGVERFVICDDRTTELAYGFEYEGSLERWTSYLRGVRTGDELGRQTFAAGDPRVTYEPHRIAVIYAIAPGIAPLAHDGIGDAHRDTLGTEGIVVVPVPDVLGYTRLYLELDGASTARRLVSKDIPVLSTCTY